MLVDFLDPCDECDGIGQGAHHGTCQYCNGLGLVVSETDIDKGADRLQVKLWDLAHIVVTTELAERLFRAAITTLIERWSERTET